MRSTIRGLLAMAAVFVASAGVTVPALAVEEGASEPDWIQVGSYTPPIVRSNHGMAFDAERGALLLFGGSGPTNVNGTLGDTWTFDGSRWTERHPPTSPPARRSPAIAYDAARKEVVMFGGLGPGAPLADTWTWDGATWTERHPVNVPPARSVAELAYDPVSERVVLFGGYNSTTFLGFGDTWTWDGSDWTQEVTGVAPVPRWGFGFADGGAASGPVLFGGFTGLPQSGMLNDTWTWDGFTRTWTPHVGPTLPPPRTGVQMVYDPSLGKAVMFGGFVNHPHASVGGSGVTVGTQQWYQDVWTWDGSGWSELDGKPPLLRVYGGMEYDSVHSRMIVFGGNVFQEGVASGRANDTWSFDGSAWERLDLNAPDELANAMIAREGSGTAILYGGLSEHGAPTDRTWRWNGGDWELLAPAQSPGARSASAMIFDPSRNEAVLFGGQRGNDGGASDTWTWDGTNWTERQTAVSPPPRSHASIAYDAAAGQVLLFGGQDDGGFALGDTWIWDGVAWTEQYPEVSPPARAGAAMTYDPRSQRVVLFGGVMSKTEGWFGDTWTWDGTNWLKQNPSTSPSSRAHATLAFDPQSLSAILFGGTFEDAFDNETYGDTWTWDGTDWSRLFPSRGPYRRSHAAAVSGEAWVDGSGSHSSPMLLFGGARAYFSLDGAPAQYEEGTSFAADLWVFNDPTAISCECRRYGGPDDG